MAFKLRYLIMLALHSSPQLRVVESEEALSHQELSCMRESIQRRQKVLDLLLAHHRTELEWAESQRRAGKMLCIRA